MEVSLQSSKTNRILEAAAGVFTSAGFHDAKIEDIADRAGVGKGTIYLYFKDKQELFVATIENQMNLVIDKLKARSKQPGTAVERLAGILLELFQLVVNHPHVSVGDLRAARGCEAECREIFLRASRETHALLCEVFRQGQAEGALVDLEPCFAATILLGTAQGLAMEHMLGEGDVDPQGAAEALVNLMLARRVEKSAG